MAGIFVKSHRRGKSVVKAYTRLTNTLKGIASGRIHHSAVRGAVSQMSAKVILEGKIARLGHVKLDKKVAENFRKIRLATAARQRAHRIQAVRRSVLGG